MRSVLTEEIVLRIWDALLYEGAKVLYRAALTHVCLHFDELKTVQHADVPGFLTKMGQHDYDVDRFMNLCFSWSFHRRLLLKLRLHYDMVRHKAGSWNPLVCFFFSERDALI